MIKCKTFTYLDVDVTELCPHRHIPCKKMNTKELLGILNEMNNNTSKYDNRNSKHKQTIVNDVMFSKEKNYASLPVHGRRTKHLPHMPIG